MRTEQRWWDGPWPWLAYLVMYGIPWLWSPPGAAQILLSALGLAFLVFAYFKSFSLAGRRLMAVVVVMVAISIVLIPVGGGWNALAIYPAMQAAKIRPHRVAAFIVALTLSSFLVAGFLSQQPLLWWLPSLLIPVLIAGATLSREAFYDRTLALLATQEEVRRLAGLAERERMMRDLHDVVGRTLTLVALKADLVVRLATRDGEAAKAEAQTIADQARAGLEEVSVALAGGAGGSLANEIAVSAEALEAVGIGLDFRGQSSSVPGDAGAVLAMTLREAITNVIRHSGASHCFIELETGGATVRLSVTDNGTGGPFEDGNGLTGMRQRLFAAGGELKLLGQRSGTMLIATVPT